jgi:Putative metallopeptidase
VIVRRLVLMSLLISALALAVAGCGGGSSSSSSSGSTSSTASAADIGSESSGGTETTADSSSSEGAGEIKAVWQKPRGEENKVGYELLEASETRYLAKSLASAFELPNTLTIKGVNGFGGGPFYNPEDNSITLPYEFTTVVLGVIAQSDPEESQYEWGEAVGAVDSFILAHEFAHALIHNFELPVLGREEDAADGVATALLLLASEGSVYAADAAEFWLNFSGRQDPPQLAEYADNHSFDRQRADNILCWIGGAEEELLVAFVENEVLPESRAVSCPGEWELLRRSVEQVMEPHLQHPLDLQPGIGAEAEREEAEGEKKSAAEG